MKIHAELKPLSGKYYGSEIALTNENGGEALIQVWINGVGDNIPSERELGDHYHQNDQGQWIDEHGYGYEICNDHYESQIALQVSQAIVDAINSREF